MKNEQMAQASWPMINLRAKEAERAAQMFKRQKAELVDNDDMFFDAQQYHTSNKSVANILSQDTSATAAASKAADGAANEDNQ